MQLNDLLPQNNLPVIAGNVAQYWLDIGGIFVSGGCNLFGTFGDGGTPLGSLAPTDLAGLSPTRVDPRLGSLDFHGGTTLNLLPQTGSPAVDAGDDALITMPYLLITDQRGGLRQAGNQVDIGAVEVGGLLRIAAFQDAGSRFDITFSTEPGWPHHLESQDGLSADPWEFVPGSSVPGDGAEITVFDSRPHSSSNRFDRAVMRP